MPIFSRYNWNSFNYVCAFQEIYLLLKEMLTYFKKIIWSKNILVIFTLIELNNITIKEGFGIYLVQLLSDM